MKASIHLLSLLFALSAVLLVPRGITALAGSYLTCEGLQIQTGAHEYVGVRCGSPHLYGGGMPVDCASRNCYAQTFNCPVNVCRDPGEPSSAKCWYTEPDRMVKYGRCGTTTEAASKCVFCTKYFCAAGKKYKSRDPMTRECMDPRCEIVMYRLSACAVP